MTATEAKVEPEIVLFGVEHQLPSRFLSKVHVAPNGCWLWTGARDREGYGLYWVDGKCVRAHRFALACVLGPSTLPVLHSCDTPPCVNPDDLSYGTQGDNVAEMIERHHHVVPTGEHHGRAKLTDNEVQQLRYERLMGAPVRVLALRFGISERHVYDLCAGRYRFDPEKAGARKVEW